MILGSTWSNVWYVSDSGSHENHCHTKSAPCKNLQTVLDRVQKMYGNGANIVVTSPVLTLASSMTNKVSFTLTTVSDEYVTVTAGG